MSGLLIWIGILTRTIINIAELCGLVLILCLMITCEISLIVLNQKQYTLFNKVYERHDINVILYYQNDLASMLLDIATFNLAHWLFAYNYWALSWRVELIQTVCLLTSITADLTLSTSWCRWLMCWYLPLTGYCTITTKWEHKKIELYSENAFLAISCVILM